MGTGCTTLAALASAALWPAVLSAGPIDPPSGPVKSTYKTLSEVEPRIAVNAVNTPGDADALYVISQPGSYYLTGNISGIAGKYGVEITCSDVTLDLSGFVMTGGSGTLDGIHTHTAYEGLVVRNGTLRKWDNGVFLVANGGRVERIVAVGNRTSGIDAGFGSSVHVISCEAQGNGGLAGIRVGPNAVVRDCVSVDNALVGILFDGPDGSGADCVANGNDTGFLFRGAVALENCTSAGNSFGFFGEVPGATLTGCVATGSDLDGMQLGPGTVLRGCNASLNLGRGIQVGEGSTLASCAAVGNKLHGIEVGDGSGVFDCSASGNSGNGIDAKAGCTVSGATVRGNARGVQVGSRSTVSGCTASSNGAGVYTDGSDSRIDGNNVTLNTVGIDIDAAGNVVMRNTASGNTSANYSIVGGNDVGPIGTAAGSTSPWANIAF